MNATAAPSVTASKNKDSGYLITFSQGVIIIVAFLLIGFFAPFCGIVGTNIPVMFVTVGIVTGCIYQFITSKKGFLLVSGMSALAMATGCIIGISYIAKTQQMLS